MLEKERRVITQRIKHPVQPGGKKHSKAKWTKKHTVLVVALLSLIVAIATVTIIIYMGLTTGIKKSFHNQSKTKWQVQQFTPQVPVEMNTVKTGQKAS